jgi:uncharacterized protein (DUF2249 family)
LIWSKERLIPGSYIHQNTFQEEQMMSQNQPQLVDVRQTPPAQRHPMIFGTFESLKPGQSLELVNDHDPKPLFYQFQAELTGQFEWNYLERGPEVWRVEIRKIQ